MCVGLYLRKSLGLGPLRLNASMGGLGLSAGLRGARVGVDARGRAYVHCGRGGVYYRSFLSSSGGPSPDNSRQPAVAVTTSEQRTIDSGDVAEMAPQSAASLLAELQHRNGLFPFHLAYGLVSIGATVAAFVLERRIVGAVLATMAVAGTIALSVWMRRRRTFRLHYDLDDDYRRRYSQVVNALKDLQQAQRVWLIQSEADVHDQRYHAGASKTIRRCLVRPAISLPPHIKSNVVPPMIPAGRQSLYLLPDRVLIYEGHRVGAVEYSELSLESHRTRFIENERPPADARQVDTTWKYVNKDGGPDRRFNGNRQLPVMEYAEILWRSASGLNELFQVSRADVAEAFVESINQLAIGWAGRRH